MNSQLIDIMSKRVLLSDTDIQLCADYFEPVLFPKNQTIEEVGKIPRYLYFVLSGFVRLFHWNDNGDAVTTHINCPPGFITDYQSFLHQTKATDNLECITACELLRITKKDLDFVTQNSAALKDFSIWVFQQSISYNENRSKELATLSAKQRYQKLIERDAAILQNVPIQYIASFLGIKPESLSRIRRQVM